MPNLDERSDMDKGTCAVEGCEKPAAQRGWCGMHYQRWRTRGETGPAAPEKRSAGSAPASCPVEGCGKPVRSNGYCHRHSENLRNYGHAVPVRDLPLDAKLRAIGWTVMPSGCWEWKGKRNEHGYGIFFAVRLGLDGVRAHRVVYEHLVEPIPEGMVLRHRCDNPPCVNPEHLVPGTHAENMADMVERGRHWMHGRTECDNGHDLTLPGAVRETERERLCVECARDRSRRYAERQRAS